MLYCQTSDIHYSFTWNRHLGIVEEMFIQLFYDATCISYVLEYSPGLKLKLGQLTHPN